MQNSETPKWVAIIVVIFLTIVGGMFAWTQGQISTNARDIRELYRDVSTTLTHVEWIREHMEEE